MGAILLQKKADSKKHPIAYYSKTLSAVERNYDIYDLELLAIVNTLDHWRSYLAGSHTKSSSTPITKIYYTGKNPTRLADMLQGKYSCYQNTTLKSIISKEQPMDTRMHYHDDWTMIRDKMTIKI
jgi:hypothetical protein